MEHSLSNLQKALDDTANRGDPKKRKRAAVLGVPLPSQSKWNAMLKAHAPGCGSPMRIPGTQGGRMACGAKLGDKRMFCPYCEAQGVVEALLRS